MISYVYMTSLEQNFILNLDVFKRHPILKVLGDLNLEMTFSWR